MKDIKEKIVIIGLDGVPYRLIKDLSSKNIMPETLRILKDGQFLQMESSIPEISSVAWSSIITGKNPGEHGIFGYTDIPQGTYRLTFPNFNNLKAQPFWQINSKAKSIILNVPSTFPPKPLNGIHISGFVSLDLERSVFPKSLIPQLKKFNYQIDVDSSKAHHSIDLFLDNLDNTLNKRIETYRYLWKNNDWDIFMLVFTGTDRLSHFLWEAYENENHKYYFSFIEHFKKIDKIIGEIYDSISSEDMLIILSDHGFELLQQDVNINAVLREHGLLKLPLDSKRNYADIDQKTKVFALEPSRLYINLKNKYPKGGVDSKDYQSLIKDLFEIFSNLNYGGKNIIKQIYKREDIYSGPYSPNAPDLILLSNPGFNLKSGLKSSAVFEKNIFTGKHTQNDAFLFIRNNPLLDYKLQNPSVEDVFPIINTFVKTKILSHKK